MISRLLTAIAATLLVACPAAPLRDVSPTPDRLPDILHATVGLTNGYGDPYCAGAVYRESIVTAAHCVTDHDENGNVVVKDHVSVGFYDDWDDSTFVFSAISEYHVSYQDPVQDIAVLYPSEIVGQRAQLSLSPDAPFNGQQVVVVGHPLGYGYTVTEGVVSRATRHGGAYPDQLWTQISAPVSPGNSGGPVVNRYGELIGIVSFRLISGAGAEPHLAGIVHWQVLRDVLE